MTDSAALDLDDLIDQITARQFGMPVRAMEKILTFGQRAVPRLADALTRWHDDEQRERLWLIILLGELRDPAGVEPLVTQMRRTWFLPHAIASAEGLAKIGPPAVPMLLEVVTKGGDLERLYAYASLGWIQDDRAFATLLGALERDRSLGDVVAMALADHGRPGAIASLYEAYQTGEPWQRMEFEDAIRQLHWGDQAEPLWTMDWRLRYRTLAHLGTFDIGWIGIIATVHERAGVTRTRPVVPVRALEEITKDLPDRPAPRELCDDCGEPIQLPTGVPACPETALNVARYQLDVLNRAREEGIEDLFDLLDEMEAGEWEQYAEGEPSDPAVRAAWRDERDEMKVQLLTCRWLIEQGAESVGAGKALILAQAAWLADRYGDSDGLFRPAAPLRRTIPKVGRNDPCPCGSGRKYKHCCLGKPD